MNTIKSKLSGICEVLIVDDSDENLKLLAKILSAEGYSVRPAISGELALRSIKAKLPDIVLLDVRMPEMDGYEVCRLLKADESTRDIPVIFIIALDDEPSKIEGFQAGGVDYISNPFRKEEVLARVKTHLNLYLLQNELKTKNRKLESEVIKRKNAELASEKRIIALTQPIADTIAIDFSELLNIAEIQNLQDQFADAFGVASIITHPDGKPITKPSNFCRLCNDIIRGTELGLKNCMNSDALLGKHNPDNPTIQPCLSGGFWDARLSISVWGLQNRKWCEVKST